VRQTQQVDLFPKTVIKKLVGLFVANLVYHKTSKGKNSFCIQSKYYVKIASDFEPASWRKISARKRAKNSEFVWGIRRESLGRASRVPYLGF